MEFVQWHEIIKLAVKQKGKAAVYIANDLNLDQEQDLTYVYEFVRDQMKSIFGDGTTNYLNSLMTFTLGGMIFFDDPFEAGRFYGIFETDIFPPGRLFVMLIDAGGELVTQNV